MSAHAPFRAATAGSAALSGAAMIAALRSPTLTEGAGADPFRADIRPTGEPGPDLELRDAIRRFELGRVDEALGLVTDLIEAHPHWVEAHVAMAQLLSQTGALEIFEQFLTDTLVEAGNDMALVTTCVRLLSEAGCHDTVDALMPALRARHGDHLFFSLTEAITASELDDLDRADRLFAECARQGGLLSLPHARHLIRRGEATRAATLVEAFLREQPRHQGAWGLLATAWRMTGDSRHDWLVHRPGLVATTDLEIAPDDLQALAGCLRTLHVARHHPFDQSLRGGTQTAGRLFRHDDPLIRRVREAMQRAVRAHLDALPASDKAHPVLGMDRSRFRFTDSWSVRLVDGGFHVSHFHPRGTLSSAFYVVCPQDPRQTGKAGWLTIGEPPESLRTGLPPLQMIEPKPGRLALFPSFMWHGTRPFPRGERMTIAFDTVLGD